MSDHVDGPRSIGDPAADLTDLFAFTNPENPSARPFYLAWDVAALKKLPNLLQHSNVLCIIVEVDAHHVLDPARGSLFGAIAETVPISRQRTLIGPPVFRIDWVGRPEQTNMRLNNPAMLRIDDLRDLWNQQTPLQSRRSCSGCSWSA